MARTKAYLVVALATVLSMVGSLVAPFAQQHVALAGDQAWESIAIPARVDVGDVQSPVVANDGTIFVATGPAGVETLIRNSTNGGSTFSAGVVPVASVIVDIAVSPTFGTDRTVFTLHADGTVRFSTDGGTTFALLGAAGNTGVIGVSAGVTPEALAVAPNYTNGVGDLLVGATSAAGASGGQDHAFRSQVNLGDGNTVAENFAAYGGINAATIGDTAGEGVVDVLFSPNYVSDGTVIAIGTMLATADADFCAAATACEVRSVNGAAFVGPVAIAAQFLTAAGTAQASLPAGYNPTSADNYFVVVSNGANAAPSGFYRRSAGQWQQTLTTVDLVSVASSGSFSSAIVLAGERALSQVRRSGNGGTTFAAAPAAVGGTAPADVRVALSQNFASDNTVYVATSGAGGGFFRSTTGGGTSSSYTGVGLHSSNMTNVRGFAIAPNFNTSAVAFLVVDAGVGVANSVFRTSNLNAISPGTGNSGAGWTRVSSLAGVTTVGVSAGFATDNTVWIGVNDGTLQKSSDGGNSFSGAFITQNPVPVTRQGNGLHVVSANTFFIVGGQTAANLNQVVKSTDSGISYTITTITGLQNITSFVLSPNYATDNTIAVGGLTPAGLSQVYWSKDGGATFTQVGGNLTASAGAGTQVAFSDKYATDKAVYASASHGTSGEVHRWIDGTSTAWTNLRMSGINTAAAAVYVPGLAGFVNSGNLGVANGVLYASRTAVGVHAISRSLTPTSSPAATSFTASTWLDLQWVPRGGVAIFAAPGSGSLRQALIRNPLTGGIIGAAGTNVGLGPDLAVSTGDDGFNLNGVVQVGLQVVSRGASSNQLVGINTNVPGAGPIQIVSYHDNMLTAPVLAQPADKATIPLPGQPVAHPQITWQPYSGLILAPSFTGYLVRFSTSADFSDQINTTYGVTAGLTATPALAGALAGAPAFTAGANYYYQLAVVASAVAGSYPAAGAAIAGQQMDVVSPWSNVKSYGSAAGVPLLLTPTSAPGLTTVVPSKQITFNWQAVALATDYRIQVSADGIIDSLSPVGAYKNAVITKLIGSASPSYTLTEAEAALLQDNTQYFWHVQAIFGTNEGNYTNLSAQAGASGFFRTPVGSTTSSSVTVALASLINTVNPSASILSIAWAQDTATGEFKFFAPGVGTSTLTTLQPNTALFLNLTVTSRLRISGRDPITVPAGGRWVALGSSTLVELVP